jgi:hypothetical protein
MVLSDRSRCSRGRSVLQAAPDRSLPLRRERPGSYTPANALQTRSLKRLRQRDTRYPRAVATVGRVIRAPERLLLRNTRSRRFHVPGPRVPDGTAALSTPYATARIR